MQNRSPPFGFFANRTGAAKGDDDWRIYPLDIFSSSHSFRTTNSVLEIEYNGPHVGVSPSFRRTSWSILGLCGGNLSANTLLNRGRNSWYCSGTISSKGRSFISFASIALLISWSDALNIISFPFFGVLKKDDPLSITMFPQNGLCGRIVGSNTSLTEYAGSRGSSVTSWTVTGALLQCVGQYWEPNVTVFDAKYTATSCNLSQGIPTTMG